MTALNIIPPRNRLGHVTARPWEDVVKVFWSRVRKTNDCWLYAGNSFAAGYPKVDIDGTKRLAHHVAWRILHGEWPPAGKVVCHTCDIRACIRPEHLVLGTQTDNMRDAARKGRLGGAFRSISEATAIAIKSDLADGLSQAVIARRHGTTKHVVWRIAAGRSWNYLDEPPLGDEPKKPNRNALAEP